jgi:hypothetical protein
MLRKIIYMMLGLALTAAPSVAVDVKLTEQGMEINAGVAGRYGLSYPKLASPDDHSSIAGQIALKPDGQGATMVYPSGGKLSIDRQSDGSWLFHFTEIPSDKMKFWYGVCFPISVSGEGAAWSANGGISQPFPGEKGRINLYQGTPGTLAFRHRGAGFLVACSLPTFVQVQDVRGWGKEEFHFAWCYYFPGKATTAEIRYTIKITDP